MSADPNCSGCHGLGCDGGGQMACAQCGQAQPRRAVAGRAVTYHNAPSSTVITRDECFVRRVFVRATEYTRNGPVRAAEIELAIMGLNDQAQVTLFPVTDEEIKRLEAAVRNNTPLRFTLEKS